jgi:hypothetical protein
VKKANKGFDIETIREFKAKMKAASAHFIFPDNTENPTSEYAQFYFIGMFEGREVIYDAALYTLRLKYESELHALAEEKLVQHFPHYKGDTDGEQNIAQEEEMGLMMAELMMEIEEEGQLKVQEEIDIDDEFDFGIGLEVSLNVDEITPSLIEKFVVDFNNGAVQLDPVLYSFEHDDEE